MGRSRGSCILRAAVMMLNHIGQQDVAEKVKNTWSCTIEEGIHTPDIFVKGISSKKVGTKEFTEAVIQRLGEKPKSLPKASYEKDISLSIPKYQRKKPASKMLKGVDIFVDWKGSNAEELAAKLEKFNSDIKLTMITNRGVKVWPEGFDETFCTDHWRCRYEVDNGHPASKNSIPRILTQALESDVDIIKTENLYEFEGVRGYSLGQGQ